MIRRLQVMVYVAVVAALALAAGGMLFSTLMAYDDEGYVLYSFKMFAEHGNLYGSVFSQYGPFPFEFALLLHAFGLPFTIDAGRLVDLAEWSVSSVLLSAVVWRATRSFAFTLFGLALTFGILWVSISEPNHPGNLIAVLVALLAFAAFHVRRFEAALVPIAVLSACLILTKINVGILASFSAFAAMVLMSPTGKFRGLTVAGLAFLAALVPVVLMKALITEPWVVTFALLSASGGVCAVLAAAQQRGEPLAPKYWVHSVASGLAAAALVLGIAVIDRTSPHDLLKGILLEPMLHPVRYHVHVTWPSGIRWEVAASLAVFAAIFALSRSGPQGRTRAATAVALLRPFGFLGLAFPFLHYVQVLPERELLPYVAPWVWLFLWPVPDSKPAYSEARLYLGLLLWGQWLHAYPVPGSQIAWSVYLAIPLGSIGTWEALQHLTRQWKPARRRRFALAVSILVLIPAASAAAGMLSIGSRYLDSETSGLPGTRLLRIPDRTTADYQIMVMNARSYADVLFSNSGMFSFNLWTGLPTPTLANVTQWFLMLSPEQHAAIMEQLAEHPRACVIQQDDILGVLAKQHTSVESPTTSYLRSHYHKAFSADGFEFLVANGRTIEPLGFYEVLTLAGSPHSMVRFSYDAPVPVTFASLAEITADQPPSSAVEATGRVRITPIGEDGTPAGSSHSAGFPLTLSGRVRVEVFVEHALPVPVLTDSLLVARTSDGTRCAVLRPSS